jgi:hypothetical protein
MLRPIDRDEAQAHPLRELLGLGASDPVVSGAAHNELETSLLPRDHPRWVKDALTVSSRAREIIAHLRPVALRILGFWDHRVRFTVVAGVRVAIDASGSYRI